MLTIASIFEGIPVAKKSIADFADYLIRQMGMIRIIDPADNSF